MAEVIRIPNRHCATRTAAVDLLVLHAMGEWVISRRGLYHHCTDYLQSSGLSVHAFCLPDGRIIESVDPALKAFHAGQANDRSIGMELVIAGGHDLTSLRQRMNDVDAPPFTAAQYEAAGWWFRQQADEHGLDQSSIRTHAELDPARKEDPGRAFDMARFLQVFDR